MDSSGKRMGAAAAACALSLWATALAAQSDLSAAAVAEEMAAAEPVFGPADEAEAEAFFDGLMEVQLRHLHSVGATVALVRGGEVLFARGYGYADFDKGVSVDAEETLFRIGSVSKLFVWTAVMQLVEAGQLDLNVDILQYLGDVEFGRTWDEPVTLANLMTHTPGFEDRVLGLFTHDEAKLGPLDELLAAQTPAQVRPPGDRPSYSNHGTAMAALVVERVSGRSFRDFVQERILDPLGMEGTSLDQPLPEALAKRMSKGYRYAGDHFEEEEFELIPLYPAGTVSASATDMAKLMIAYLQDGRLGGARILEAETARRMRRPLLSVDPAVNVSPHGFMDMSTRGIRIVGHGGDTLWFHTLFAIFPDHDLGLFVSYNTDKGAAGRGPLLEAFLDRYFVSAARPPEPPADFGDRAALYTGEFRANRYAHTTVTKVGAVVGSFRVEANDEGELLALQGRFVETSPRVFTELDGERQLVFIEGEDGVMSHFYLAQFPIMTFERVPMLESQRLHLVLVVSVAVVLGLTFLAWPAGWVIRRWFGVRQDPAARISWSARLSLWLLAALLLAMLIGMGSLASDPNKLAFGELDSLETVLLLPLIALLPLVFAVWAMFGVWKAGQGTRTGRALYSAAVLLSLAFYWQLSVWNLLGFHF